MPAKESLLLAKPRANPSLWKTSRRRKALQFDEKREALLNTAAALFRERSYAEVSLNDLADILKITKPTLYYYVPSKDELLYEIVTRGQEQALAILRAVDKGPGTGVEKLRSIMLQYAELIVSDYGACVLVTRPRDLNPKFNHQIAMRIRAGNEIILRVLALGERDGTLQVPDRKVALQVLFGSINWDPRWYDPTGRIKLDDFIRMQVDLLLNGVATERKGGPASPSKKTRPKRKA